MSTTTAPKEGAGPGRGRGRLAWSQFALTLVVLAAALIIAAARGSRWGPVGWLPVVAGFSAVGALVAAKTSNRVGWLFLAVGLCLALGVALAEYAGRASGNGLPLKPWVGWTFTIVIEASFPLFMLALLLFPTGNLPSKWWRPAAWAVVIAGMLNMAFVAISDVNFSNNFPSLTDPVTIVRSESLRGLYSGLQAVPLWVFVVWAVFVVVRLFRSHGEERLQLKWFAFASLVAAIAIVVSINRGSILGFQVCAPLIPIAAGIAILKYRLYDIDVVIRRTVVFALLAGFITAVYAAVVAGIGGAVGRRSPLLSFAAAVAVAVAFQPARDAARRLADRLVFGKRATPYEVLTDFSTQAADAGSTDEVLPRIARIVAEGTGSRRTRVWLRVAGSLAPSASWPTDDQAPPEPVRMSGDELPDLHATESFPVTHGGAVLGAIVLDADPADPLTPAKSKLVRDVAAQAGLVLRNAQLLEDLKASRRRIVAAQDEERRRIQRSLRDGAERRLVTLGVKLGDTERVARTEGALEAIEAVRGLRTDSERALENLRDLARGVYPPLLEEEGIVPALEAQVGSSAVPTEVLAEGIGRYSIDVEAAVYFCSLEAVQNAVKYSEATTVRVRLLSRNGELAFEVADDGRGFDASGTRYGTGLQGMADRLAAIGGVLDVRSVPGGGTTVAGRVPIAGTTVETSGAGLAAASRVAGE